MSEKESSKNTTQHSGEFSKQSEEESNDETVFMTDDFKNLNFPEEKKEELDTSTTDEILEEVFESEDTDDTSVEKQEDYIDEELLKKQEETFSEEELTERHEKSLELKKQGNEEYKNNLSLESINTYTEALRLCPLKHKNDRAIFYANRAAAKIKTGRTKSAIDDCTKAIEYNSDYVRAYLRRAKLYEESDKLDESLEDYKKVLELDSHNQESLSALVRLPPLIQERNEKLKDEMLGKLKDLGNMFLKPFGLSTNNFKMQQDPNSGSYSVNFQQ